MDISSYFNPNLILFLNVKSRDEALRQMVDAATKEGKILDGPEFYQALIEREKVVSTGIGMEMAIPHAKLSNYDHFFIVVSVLQSPVDWNTIDRVPVRLIFMIGGPDDKQTEYLQILSKLTQMIKNEEKRKKILKSKSSEAIMQLLTASDEKKN